MIPPRTELAGKVAIVTGAAGQIGQVIALDLLKAGARVAWVYHRDRTLRKAVGRLGKGVGRSLLVRADVRKEADVRRLVLFLCSEAARNITGQAIDVNAGFGLWSG